jgi:GNAT superfamily N-acetyltransferase
VSSSTELTVYYLEMKDPGLFLPKADPVGFNIQQIKPPSVELNKHFYSVVGKDWNWSDRFKWTEDHWEVYVHNPNLETWVGYFNETAIGYFELKRQTGGDVKIVYFGLAPQYIGKGLGGALLSSAIKRAWEMPETIRLWVHTCSRDHKYALDNYLKRGFKIFKTERHEW